MEDQAPSAAWPLITPELPGIGGAIKEEPAHFVVEELPLYLPSGQRAHLYLRLRRQGMTTREVVRGLARELGLGENEIGYAGLKDKQAVTVQTISLPAEGLTEAEAARRAASLGLEVLETGLHGNKLKRGHLLGNRFRILVSGVGEDAPARAQAIADALNERGLPNFFGQQRFGKDGDNAEQGRRALRGRGPRQKWLRTLVLNAYQSELFNRWLALRMERGLFQRLLDGDVAKKTDTGGIFTVEDAAAEQPRLDAGEITYTGPIYGGKMRAAQAAAAELEDLILAEEALSLGQLKKAGLKGSRRPARLMVGPIGLEPAEEGLWFSFALPAGSYATTLLREFMK